MNFIQLHTIQVTQQDGTISQSKEIYINAQYIMAFEQVKLNTGGIHTAVRLASDTAPILNVVETPEQIGQLLFPDDDVVFQQVDAISPSAIHEAVKELVTGVPPVAKTSNKKK